MRSKPSQQTLQSFAAAIRELEQQTTAAAKERDRKLAEARKSVQVMAQHAAQVRDLREILSEIAPQFYKETFGHAFDLNADPTRDEVLRGLRDAAAYLEATPQLPIHGELISLDVPAPYGSTDVERRAALDDIAKVFDAKPDETWYATSGSYSVCGPEFGPVRIYASVSLKGPKPEPEPEPAVESGECLDERMVADDAPEAVSAE